MLLANYFVKLCAISIRNTMEILDFRRFSQFRNYNH